MFEPARPHHAQLVRRPIQAIAIIVPWWLLWWSPSTLLGAIAGALVVACAALHGLGSTASALLDRPDRADTGSWSRADLLAVGLAIFLIVGGAICALHRFDHTAQIVVLAVGLVLHTFAIAGTRRGPPLLDARAVAGRVSAATLLLWIVIVGVAAIHVLGLVASQASSVYDDDGHWFAAVKRLRDVGGFEDPLGYGRAYQLGGTVISAALAATVREVSCTRLGEAIGFIVTLGLLANLALSPRDRRQAGALILLLLVLVVSSKAQAETELSTFWLPAALLIAAYRRIIVTRPVEPGGGLRSWLAFTLLVAASCIVRLELLPFAGAAVVLAQRPERLVVLARRTAALAAVFIGCIAPLVVDRAINGGDAGPVAARWLPVAVTCVMIGGLLVLRARATLALTPIAQLAWAAGASSAVLFLVRTPSGGYSQRLMWIPIFTLLFVVLAVLARAQWAPRQELAGLHLFRGVRRRFRFSTAAMLVFVTLGFITRAQDPSVRFTWRARFLPWFERASQLASASSSGLAAVEPYDRLLAQVPRNVPVLLWVDRPTKIDYRDRALFDIRVARYSRLRWVTWGRERSPFPEIAHAAGAGFLLVQSDMLVGHRGRWSELYRFWCHRENPFADPRLGIPAVCADPLEAEILRHRTVATDGEVTLIDLRTVVAGP